MSHLAYGCMKQIDNQTEKKTYSMKQILKIKSNESKIRYGVKKSSCYETENRIAKLKKNK